MALPPYAFVPGRHPHPRSDSHGHSYLTPEQVPTPLDPVFPERSSDFCYAIDLFNAGFYWEAHEVWEGLWIASGRAGEIADFLKALIKLAAAGVKARVGQITGVQRHALRSLELLGSVHAGLSSDVGHFCGILIEPLIRDVRHLSEHPIVDETPTVAGRVVLPIRLTLSHLDPSA